MPELLTEITDLKEKRAGLVAEMRVILNKAEGEKRDFTAEELQEYNRLEADVDGLTARSNRLEEQRERERGSATPPVLDPRRLGASDEEREAHEAEYRTVYMKYLRQGRSELDSDERKTLDTGYAEMRDQSHTGSAGGFVVPTSMEKSLQEHQIQAGAMRQIGVTLITTQSGEDLQVPKTTVHGAAQLIGENTAFTGADETFGQVTLKAWIYGRLIKVPIGLIQDAAVDLEGYLSRELGRSIGQLQNTHYVVGDGASKPNGVVTAASVGKQGIAGQTLTIIYDDVVDLIYSIAVPYRRDGKFLASDKILQALRKLKDSQGHPLWEPSVQAGLPDRLLGYPVYNDPDLAVPAASAKTMAFGDFTTYWIRDVKGLVVRRLDERFADALQVGFMAWCRSDGNQIDTTGAIKLYQHSAT